MGLNPAFEIPPELAFDMGWAGCALAAIPLRVRPRRQGASGRCERARHVRAGDVDRRLLTAVRAGAEAVTVGIPVEDSIRSKPYATTAYGAMASGCGTHAVVLRLLAKSLALQEVGRARTMRRRWRPRRPGGPGAWPRASAASSSPRCASLR